MQKLSNCHKRPIVRGKTHGFWVCSQCGMRDYVIVKGPPPEPKKAYAYGNGHDLSKDFPVRKEKTADTRDMVRHLTSAVNYTACGVHGFRTTGVSRVNCKSCMRTKAYEDAMKRREESISDKNSEDVENARQEPDGIE